HCRYTLWNPAMERISGVSAAEALGCCAFELFPFLKESGEDRYFVETLAGNNVVARDRPYTVPQTGRQGFFDGHYSPLRDAAGQILGGLAIIRDTTERKQTEEALRHVSSKARCLLWYAEIEDQGREVLRWRVQIPDEEAAQRFFPVEVAPGDSYVRAWASSRLAEDRQRTDDYGNRQVR